MDTHGAFLETYLPPLENTLSSIDKNTCPRLDDVQGSSLTLSPLTLNTRAAGSARPGIRPKKHSGLEGEREKTTLAKLWSNMNPQWQGKGHRGAVEGEGRGAPLGEGSQAPVSGGKGLHSQVFSHLNKGLLGMCRLSIELNR